MSKVIGIINKHWNKQGKMLASCLNMVAFMEKRMTSQTDFLWDVQCLEEERKKALSGLLGIYIPNNQENRHAIAMREVNSAIVENFGSSVQLKSSLKKIPESSNMIFTSISNEEEVKLIHGHNKGLIISIEESSDLNRFANIELFNANDKTLSAEEIVSMILEKQDLVKKL